LSVAPGHYERTGLSGEATGFVGIEDVEGTSSADTLFGDDGSNQLFGDGGNDRLGAGGTRPARRRSGC
jgi:Ca2+-binding RTX toxin-like protein